MEVASITGSTRLYEHSSGTGSGLPSRSCIQSENSAFSAYLRDSRMQPSELYIPNSSGDTLASRTKSRYGHLNNGHEASIVKIKSFIPYFSSDRYVINHHNGGGQGQGEQQHQAIGSPGRHYTPVSGCSEDAHPNHCQCVPTGSTKQIPFSQLFKIITCIIKICQDPFVKLMLQYTTRSLLDQCRGHVPQSNSSQHLHQPIQHEWTSRW